MHTIEANLSRIRETIGIHARKAGRDPDRITVVAVTKTVPPQRIREALAAGLRVFGENRVQEAKAKIPQVDAEAQWHLVGHLQTNKARDAVALFSLIHSVDSLRLAQAIDKQAARLGKTQRVLVQVNVSGEPSKFGVAPEETAELLRAMAALSHVRVEGLMTIPPLDPDPEASRPYYRRLRELAETLNALHLEGVSMQELSMGMSGDYPVAVEEGATLVRIGTALFGPRPPAPPVRQAGEGSGRTG